MAFARRMVTNGRDRVQLGAWKSSDSIANMVPFPADEVLHPDTVVEAKRTAREQGYDRAYTAAMAPHQTVPFLDHGFELVEELHLLRRPLGAEPAADRSRLRRGRRTDHDEVLRFDGLAFDDFWQFDRSSLIEAMRATPRHRFVVSKTTPPVGYHVTGLASANAYIQRVAVDPAAQGQGWGTCLVQDALRWAWRNGATLAHVNTQLTNERAVALYEKCGFTLANHRLHVLRAKL